MKILIAYYSRTKNTEKVALAIKKELEKKGHQVDVEKIKPKKEHGFWGWFFLRIFKGDCEIEEPKIKDVSEYDAILIGSPNWSRLSLPVARYLKEINGLKYKKVGFFSTTALWPFFEWYVFSAILLDLTFSNLVEKKGGRIVESILLSSLFKKWGYLSEYGKKEIKRLLDKIESPILSLKEFFLNQKEVVLTRFLLLIFSTLLFFILFFQLFYSFFFDQILFFIPHVSLFLILFFASFSLIFLLKRKIGIFLGKYIAGASFISLWTIFVSFFLFETYLILLGYVLIFAFISFFRDFKAVVFTLMVSLLNYLFLFLFFPQKEILNLGFDIPALIFSGLIISLLTKNLQKSFESLLEAQEEAETASTVLEIKVRAKTKELRELAESLEEKVKERTKELQEKKEKLQEKTKELQKKIEELEKFHRLTVGRELKMVELKKEIAKLKEELEKYKKEKS